MIHEQSNVTGQLATVGDVPEILRGLDPAAVDFARCARSTETVKAYGKQWRTFLAWCELRGERPMPASPSTVANFVAHRTGEGVRPSTIGVALAAVRQAHLLAGHPSPAADPQVLLVVAGVRRKLGVRPAAKEAILADAVCAYCASLPTTPRGLRDRSMLLLGFSGAFRRSELVAVRVEDLTFLMGGTVLRVLLPRSKTDQDGKGLEKTIHATGTPTCPVQALRGWLAAAKIESGPVYRRIFHGTGRVGDEPMNSAEVARLVKRVAVATGQDPKVFSGHSLRAGFVTQAAANGVALEEIMGTTHHRSVDVAMVYVRRGEALRADTTGKLGI